MKMATYTLDTYDDSVKRKNNIFLLTKILCGNQNSKFDHNCACGF